MSTDIVLFSISVLSAISYIALGRFKSAIAFLAIAAFLYFWRKFLTDAFKKKWIAPILRWAGIPAGLAAGGWGSYLVTEPVYNWATGLPLLIISGWFLLEAFPETSKVLKVSGFPRPKPKDKSRFEILPLLLPLTWLAMITFFYSDHSPLAFFALAATVLIIGFLRCKRQETLGVAQLKGEWKWVLFILGLAALLRYPFLHSLFAGFRSDESVEAMTAVGALKGEWATPFQTGVWGSPTLPCFLNAIGLKIFGVNLTGLRMATLTLSMLSIFVFYRWCRLYFSPRACLLAAFLSSVSWWHLFFAFSPFNTMCMILFVVCTFYFYEKALQRGARADYWWGGVFAAASVMTYIAGRLTPAMVLVFIMGCGLFAGGMAFVKTYSRHLFLSFLGFLWFIGPFICFIIQHPIEFTGRAVNLNIFAMVAASGDYWLPIKTTFWSILSFFWTSGVDERLMVPNNPILDPFTGILLLAGMVLTLFSLRKRVSWAALGGVLFGIAANAFARENPYVPPEYLNPMRLFIAFPFLMLMAARGIEWFWEMVDRSRPVMKTGAKVWLALGLAGALFFNVDMYFFRFKDRPGIWPLVGYPHLELAKIYTRIRPECHLFLDEDSFSNVITFLTGIRDVDVVGINDDCLFLPIRNKVNKNVAVFFAPRELRKDLRLFLNYYPHATITELRDPWNVIYERIVRIPKADVEAAQKGLPPGNEAP